MNYKGIYFSRNPHEHSVGGETRYDSPLLTKYRVCDQ